ncbi:binding-protein-dependent transport systems inner membrane component [Desulfatibacillum aliphaticivorans]|uniref:Binding-protein-dependent transport systems inner membrane component n=1 Tax=Desulfatibacillum aliphaticivorans TaxID=218208 RepID=B8FI99_DESAL|nr:ABC transporter permease subunit [Desulfatibacillum aliphaticivorans]ACL02666.1 binding-protein-dependent transport systems inner membrane component [Desulfatibacillum aliphaticivorans]
MERTDYFIRRLLLVIPTFIAITMLVFLLVQFVPGGPVEQALMAMKGMGSGEVGQGGGLAGSISAEQRLALEKHYGFDKPFYERYWTWLVHDRIGFTMESYAFPNKTAWQLIKERFPVSLIFGIVSFVLSYVVCIPLGIMKALRHGRPFDLISSVIVFIGYAIPPLALGMVLKMLFCGTTTGMWDIFPIAGFHSLDFAQMTGLEKIKDLFMHMFLPVLCYVVGNFAVLTLLMKNSLMEQVGRDYVRTVLAKGGSTGRAIWGHAFRNSLIPIATGFGGILTVMFAGSVIIEQVFEIPGMGRLSLEAIVGRDYPVFMGILSITSILGLLGNILSDLCYVLIDPRINFQS